MGFYMKLPRNKKEFILYLGIVSLVSVNLIAPLITFFEVGFHLYVWQETLKILPFLWITVVTLVLLTYRPAQWLTQHFAHKDDSFNSQITINILFSVLLMSIFLTVLGSFIGTQTISLKPFTLFFYKWPRNFAISLFVETCVAGPVGRMVLYQKHLREART